MKKSIPIFLLAFIAFSISAKAAPNVSVQIDGVHYFCSQNGAAPVNCAEKAELLKRKIDLCTSTGSFASYCIERSWPDFKQNNPSCLDEGGVVCVEACVNGGSAGGFCADLCR